jgi:hypothetical protein
VPLHCSQRRHGSERSSLMIARVVIPLSLGVLFLAACGGGGGSSTPVAAPPPAPPPFNVSGLEARAQVNAVELRWSNVSATTVNLFRAEAAGCDFANYATCPGGTLTENVTSPYVQTGLTNGRSYWFKIEARDAAGVAMLSNETSARNAAGLERPRRDRSVRQRHRAWSRQGSRRWQVRRRRCGAVVRSGVATLARG